MSSQSVAAGSLAARLAGVAGLEVRPDFPLSRLTTLRIGGPAELLVEVGNEAALVALRREIAARGVPFVLLGLGSNVLAPDEGLPGVVARLAGNFRRFAIRGERVAAGAAVPLARLAKRTAERGLAGLEALSGFPSTVGGAVFMNAGCYGTEIKDLVVSVRLVEADGGRRRVAMGDLEPSYRRTNLARRGAIVTRAHFLLAPGDRAASLARIEELNARRWASLPSGVANAGSIFRNPEGDFAGRLIERAGLKGVSAGGAEISSKHGNVIVNRGGATAREVLALMVRAFTAVEGGFGVRLVPELQLLGGLREIWSSETAGGAGDSA